MAGSRPPSDPRRRAAERLGRRAEWLAALALRLRGYRVIARDVRTPVGQIDLVARRGDVLAVVEVKARPSVTAAVEAVTPRQRRRLERAAANYLGGRPDLAILSLRFDIVQVPPFGWPRHLRRAWEPEGW